MEQLDKKYNMINVLSHLKVNFDKINNHALLFLFKICYNKIYTIHIDLRYLNLIINYLYENQPFIQRFELVNHKIDIFANYYSFP